MINANEAKSNYLKFINNINRFELENHKCNISMLIEDKSKGYNSTNYICNEKLHVELKSWLESYGYKVKCIESKDGDCREMLDYGTPAYIKISWED